MLIRQSVINFSKIRFISRCLGNNLSTIANTRLASENEGVHREQVVGTIRPTREQIKEFNCKYDLCQEGRFRLVSGTFLPEDSIQIKYASFGTPGPNDPAKPVILLCPSMSNSVFAMDEAEPKAGTDGEKGWWRNVVGPGEQFGIDTNHFQVITGAPLGSPFGSTSPVTINPETDNKWGPNFPEITPQDQAHMQALLLESLGIYKVFAVIGGSMGGMQALQFAANFPEKYERIASIASTAHTSPGTVALRSVQRAAVMTDPDYMNGYYPLGKGPVKGMAIARMFGTICYRSHDEFDGRFNWYPTRDENGNTIFEIERYLQHQARKFTSIVNYDANCYLVNSKSMDLMDIGAGTSSYEEGVKRIPGDKQVLLLSYSSDRLTPPKDLERLSSTLGKNNVQVHYEVLNSQFGHDAFLIASEAVHLNLRLRAFLETDVKHFGGHGIHNIQALIKDLHHN